MAYSDFTLKKVKSELNIRINENKSLFKHVKKLKISKHLRNTLKRNIPLAIAINTEKARSELIIINVLLEAKDHFTNEVSLFSGIDFNIDQDKGLTGFCDFILSNSSTQLYLESPIITIVEAKNENIIAGLGQCIAEMYAAQLFNHRENINTQNIYGAVTIGDEWRFIKLVQEQAFIDVDLYHINDIGKIIGILVAMLKMEK